MELSRRLQAVADMVTAGEIVADLGTDHGYIPIHLIESGKCNKVYAMDINEGPYKKATQHISGCGLSQQITTRLSDGMKSLENGEATAIIIAGMGGGLVIKILDQDRRLWNELNEFILQPQSELHKVRLFLQENNLKVIEENIIFEEGKYYPMMKVVKGSDRVYSEVELIYGRELIKAKHPILKEFLTKEIQVKESILNNLRTQEHTLTDNLKLKTNDEVNMEYNEFDEKRIAISKRIDELKREVDMAYEVQRTM